MGPGRKVRREAPVLHHLKNCSASSITKYVLHLVDVLRVLLTDRDVALFSLHAVQQAPRFLHSA